MGVTDRLWWSRRTGDKPVNEVGRRAWRWCKSRHRCCCWLTRGRRGWDGYWKDTRWFRSRNRREAEKACRFQINAKPIPTAGARLQPKLPPSTPYTAAVLDPPPVLVAIAEDCPTEVAKVVLVDQSRAVPHGYASQTGKHIGIGRSSVRNGEQPHFEHVRPSVVGVPNERKGVVFWSDAL